MSRILCPRCRSHGTYLGPGMMMTDCDLCTDGVGDQIFGLTDSVSVSVSVAPVTSEVRKTDIDKRAKTYKKAIQEIMNAACVSKDQAEEMFAKEYAKQ